MDLLTFTNQGIYCAQADVYIDPYGKPVKRALITHGHSDHARWGHQHYLCTDLAKPVIQYRLGPQMKIESVPFGKTVHINGVQFSFHPAGHIIGSAQIRVEYKGEVWVASGDYKVAPDGLTTPFEPIQCHAFITESTFGLPVYRWEDQALTFQKINEWWASNKAAGKTTIITGYALGKAQRLLAGLNPEIGTIFTHGAVENINEVLRQQGIPLPDTVRITAEHKKKDFIGNLVLTTPSSINTNYIKRMAPHSIGIASGWMALRGTRRRRAVDRGFVLSDHADWEGLNEAIKTTGATKVFVTHGYTSIFAKWLREQGYDAYEEQTQYEGELSEISESTQKEEEVQA